jgi:hypothetical protein
MDATLRYFIEHARKSAAGAERARKIGWHYKAVSHLAAASAFVNSALFYALHHPEATPRGFDRRLAAIDAIIRATASDIVAESGNGRNPASKDSAASGAKVAIDLLDEEI